MPTPREYEIELRRQQRINDELYKCLEKIRSQVVTEEDIDRAQRDQRATINFWMLHAGEMRNQVRDFLSALRIYLGIENRKYGISWLRNKTRNRKLRPVLDALYALYSGLDMDDE